MSPPMEPAPGEDNAAKDYVRRHASIDCPTVPKIKTSAKDMAVYLEHYAEVLLGVARQLRDRKEKEIISLQWPVCPIVMDCNGGGDGGGGE